MNNVKNELIEKLREFIDSLEDYYGDLEGFEVLLKHPIVDGKKQSYADIESFTIYHIHKTKIDV